MSTWLTLVTVAYRNSHRMESLLLSGGVKAQLEGQFLNPSGIYVDGSGNVYVVDSGNNRIQEFSSDGTFITKWGVS